MNEDEGVPDIGGTGWSRANEVGLLEGFSKRLFDWARESALDSTFADMANASSAAIDSLGKAVVPLFSSQVWKIYPDNLDGIEDVWIVQIKDVVLTDGIPLYEVPRKEIAEQLIRADSLAARRDILDGQWQTISADCRAALLRCRTDDAARYVTFALAVLDALDDGKHEA